MLTWLDKEMSAAAKAVRLEHIERLEACGVPRAALAHLGMHQYPFGVAPINEVPGGLYEPDPYGTPAVIMPVIEPGANDGATGIVDLIAFNTCRPAAVLRRTGEGIALGLELLDDDRPLRIAPTPLDWLANAGEALTILDWYAPNFFWNSLRHHPELVVRDEPTGLRLSRIMKQCVALPRIEVFHGV